MYYAIQHNTRFHYSQPIRESVMEVRMEPRTEGGQQCLRFALVTTPHARITSYRDYLGNMIHFFDIPAQHSQLTLTADTLVKVDPVVPLPGQLEQAAWDELDAMTAHGEYGDMLYAGDRTQTTAMLDAFAHELGVQRRNDPLSLLLELNTALYDAFDYDPESTHVDSTIDDALTARRGVCQDLAHIMAALVRKLGIPCRYVSGYLYHQQDIHDRSTPGASHAWVETLLPQLGWIGFDPTNNVLAGQRHIRVAIGRDYADVPPTHGIFKGTADSRLEVEVMVALAEQPAPSDDPTPSLSGWVALDEHLQQQQQ